MKVRVLLSLDVDKELWEEIYGPETRLNAATWRDVRDYVLNMVQSCSAAEAGAITGATLK